MRDQSVARSNMRVVSASFSASVMPAQSDDHAGGPAVPAQAMVQFQLDPGHEHDRAGGTDQDQRRDRGDGLQQAHPGDGGQSRGGIQRRRLAGEWTAQACAVRGAGEITAGEALCEVVADGRRGLDSGGRGPVAHDPVHDHQDDAGAGSAGGLLQVRG